MFEKEKCLERVLGSWCDDPFAAHTKQNWHWVQVKRQSQIVHTLCASDKSSEEK